MKKILLSTCFAVCLAVGLQAVDSKIAVVDFKNCVENSKLGKSEQSNFEALKKQMETVLEDREKQMQDIMGKLNDLDYLDSISQEAEHELKRKAKQFQQEAGQQQQQFYQALQQANYKIVQDVSQEIQKASKVVAKKKNLDLILNSEVTFYSGQSLDISKDVIKEMDMNYDATAEDREKDDLKKMLPMN